MALSRQRQAVMKMKLHLEGREFGRTMCGLSAVRYEIDLYDPKDSLDDLCKTCSEAMDLNAYIDCRGIGDSLYQSAAPICSSLEPSTWFIFEDSSRLPDLESIESHYPGSEEDSLEIERRERRFNQYLEMVGKRHGRPHLARSWYSKPWAGSQSCELTENQRKWIDSL